LSDRRRFFTGRAIVLDLSGLALAKDEVAALIVDLNTRGIRIMAVEGSTTACSAGPSAGDQWRARIRRARRDHREESAPGRQEGRAALAPDRGADPLGPVHRLSARRRHRHRLGRLGAEIVAGGSIHVYGALRGRAIAGSAGNAKARIFCRKFEAELVAIDGLYKTADDVGPDYRGRALQAWLDRDAIVMTALD
jgi:septum site-determining protein MinC